MAMIRLTRKVGEKPPKEVLLEIEAASKQPIVYDADCPPSSEQALREFAAQAREKRKKQQKSVVTLRMKKETLAVYKELGRGFTGIMAELLDYTAKNPELLQQMLHQTRQNTTVA